ncbi:MAG: type II secretion system protein N [Burkholderiales bacterium]
MPGFPAPSAARLVKWAGMLATLAMLAMLAWLGARVFWSLNTPTTVAPPVGIETDPVRAAQSIAARHLFGEAPATAPVVLKAAALPDIVLRGVIAPSQPGRPGAAVLTIAGKPAVAVRAGEEVAPGAKLVRVLPGSVEIERSGHVQTLSLADRGKAQTPRAGAEARPPSPPERGKAQLPRKEAGEGGG